MTKKVRSGLIAAGISLLIWAALWAFIARDLYGWSYSCDTDTACEYEDSIREKAEGSIR
jgi:hypothetical protein